MSGLADIQSMKALKLAKQNASLLQSSSYAWNLDYGLRNWRVAKSNPSSNPIVVFLGDSITDSTGATDHDHGFVGLYRNAIQLSSGMGGHGYQKFKLFADSTWTEINEGTNLSTCQGTPSSSTITIKDTCHPVKIVYSTQPDGGTFTVKIDGATQGTINCNGATSYHNVVSYDVGNAKVHSIQIIPATTGNTYVEGVSCHSGSPGVIVHQLGHPGIRAYDYSKSADIIASTSAFNPVLTVVMLGTNDAAHNDPTSYQTALDAIVKQALTVGDVLIMIMGDQPSGSTLVAPYPQYVANAKQVAINNNCAYLSIYDRWQKSYAWANGKGLMMSDGSVHPSQSGHNDIANALIEVLGGMPHSGIIQPDYNAQFTYGDLKFTNFPGRFLPGTLVSIGGVNAGAFNVAVTAGATSYSVNNTTQGENFTPLIVPNWNTSWWITNKSYAGFTVNFGTVAPSNATFDWRILE